KLVYQSAEPVPAGVVRFSEDGVHPLDEGHQIYADVITQALQQMESIHPPVDHDRKLAVPFVENHWQAAKMVPVTAAMLSDEWYELPPDGRLSQQFSGRLGTLWETKTPGSRLTFKF